MIRFVGGQVLLACSGSGGSSMWCRNEGADYGHDGVWPRRYGALSAYLPRQVPIYYFSSALVVQLLCSSLI